jgi:hypothetical protein
MLSFLEAHVLLLPSDAGGRPLPVAPREGNYQPRLRARDGRQSLPIRFIEGPPWLAPGSGARVVAELESDSLTVTAGEELEIVEGTAIVGLLTVLRVL